ncbi:MAG: tetratricopeptide repeat protein [Gemmatimonadetes bacterium]|nr:tetratricopeptide repeat protein [Gemmatimonadota bacterium]
MRAADADHARTLLARLREEVRARAATADQAVDEQVRAVTHAAVERGAFEAVAHAVGARRGPGRRGVRVALVLGVVAVSLTVWYIAARERRPTELERGMAAFAEGRLELAEGHVRASLRAQESATAARYLARILRRQGRPAEAAAVLDSAGRRHPADAAVFRELGELLAADGGRPAAAAVAFRRAVELQPDEMADWIALVRALRAAGDPAAETWLARAPANAQAALRRERPSTREVP